MDRVIIITGANDGIGLALTRTKSASGLGTPHEMTAVSAVVGRKLAEQAGKTSPVLMTGFGTGFQLWISSHFRVQMGKLLVMMAEWANQNQKGIENEKTIYIYDHPVPVAVSVDNTC
jgi:hypothetical protein